jgi:hypothetical protein
MNVVEQIVVTGALSGAGEDGKNRLIVGIWPMKKASQLMIGGS